MVLTAPRHIHRTAIAITTVLIAWSPLIAADELPKDGAWARYFVEHKRSNGQQTTSQVTIRFVGTTIENGRKHRWVEWTYAVEVDGDDGMKKTRKRVKKFLIPEKSLRESSHPLREFVRGWRGEVGKPAERIETSRREFYNGTAGMNLLFLPGVLKLAKSAKHPRVIDYQKGRLRLKSGRAGTFAAIWRVPSGAFVYVWKNDYVLWQHKDVPLGMAALKWSTKITIQQPGGKPMVQDLGTTQFSVEEWGTDAKSALPKAR